MLSWGTTGFPPNTKTSNIIAKTNCVSLEICTMSRGQRYLQVQAQKKAQAHKQAQAMAQALAHKQAQAMALALVLLVASISC